MAKILFVGGREKGFEALQNLLNLKAQIIKAYILKEDEHEAERFSSNIADLCGTKKIPFKICKNINSEYQNLKELKIDLLVVSGWRTIIDKEIINLSKYGAIAFHESLLPRYRGFAPINWAVINGETETGVTMFYLSEETDNGDIIAQEKIKIGPDETAFDIYRKTIKISSDLLNKYYPKLIKGRFKGRSQKESDADYTCARIPEDGKIIWSETSQTIHNLIRALSYPYPGAFCFLNNKKVTINKSEIPVQKKWSGKIAGRVVKINKDQGVEVLTGDGSIIIREIEVDGKVLKADQYIKSIKDTLL